MSPFFVTIMTISYPVMTGGGLIRRRDSAKMKERGVCLPVRLKTAGRIGLVELPVRFDRIVKKPLVQFYEVKNIDTPDDGIFQP